MRLDILLPYYGDVALMQAAVRSVIAQSDPDWRLIVVDDGQEPGVPEWFASLSDERVRYQRNERNLGITANFNRCVSLADGDYLVLMGTDDLMLPNYVATIRSIIAAHPGIGIVQPGVEVIDGAGRRVDPLVDRVKRRLYAPRVEGRLVLGGQDLAASLLRGCWFYFPSLCWRTDAIRAVGFRAELTVIQDLALVIDLIERGERMVLDPTVCFQYRRHTVSVSAAGALAGTRFTEARGFFVEVARRMDARGWPLAGRAARRYLSSRLHACTLLPAALRAGERAGVRSLLRHAFGPARP